MVFGFANPFVSDTVIRQTETCYGIEAASGENDKKDGRGEQPTLQKGQLAYGVRDVLSEDRVSGWSAPAEAGAEGPTPVRAPSPRNTKGTEG